MAFKHFDPNNTGKITPDGLKAVLQKSGKQLTKNELMDMINEVDKEEVKKVQSPRAFQRSDDGMWGEREEERFSISFNTFYNYVCSQTNKHSDGLEK